MATINSVLGPIDSSDLGFTLPHEHVLTSTAGFKNTYPELLDRELALKLAVDLLTEARGEGVQTIVDCTTHDLDRDVTLMEAASRGGDVQIICSTGCHLFVPHTFYPTMFRWMKPMTAETVADIRSVLATTARDSGRVRHRVLMPCSQSSTVGSTSKVV